MFICINSLCFIKAGSRMIPYHAIFYHTSSFIFTIIKLNHRDLSNLQNYIHSHLKGTRLNQLSPSHNSFWEMKDEMFCHVWCLITKQENSNKQAKSCQIHYGNTLGISFLHFPSFLPPQHPPISPAVQDGHAWWRQSQENWPAPWAPVYCWDNPLLGQWDHSPAGCEKPLQSRAGSRWRWSVWSSSCQVPPDSQGLKCTVNRER